MALSKSSTLLNSLTAILRSWRLRVCPAIFSCTDPCNLNLKGFNTNADERDIAAIIERDLAIVFICIFLSTTCRAKKGAPDSRGRRRRCEHPTRIRLLNPDPPRLAWYTLTPMGPIRLLNPATDPTRRPRRPSMALRSGPAAPAAPGRPGRNSVEGSSHVESLRTSKHSEFKPE